MASDGGTVGGGGTRDIDGDTVMSEDIDGDTEVNTDVDVNGDIDGESTGSVPVYDNDSAISAVREGACPSPIYLANISSMTCKRR